MLGRASSRHPPASRATPGAPAWGRPESDSPDGSGPRGPSRLPGRAVIRVFKSRLSPAALRPQTSWRRLAARARRCRVRVEGAARPPRVERHGAHRHGMGDSDESERRAERAARAGEASGPGVGRPVSRPPHPPGEGARAGPDVEVPPRRAPSGEGGPRGARSRRLRHQSEPSIRVAAAPGRPRMRQIIFVF